MQPMPSVLPPADPLASDQGPPPVAEFTVYLFEGGRIAAGVKSTRPVSANEVVLSFGWAIQTLIEKMKQDAKPKIAVAPAGWSPPQM